MPRNRIDGSARADRAEPTADERHAAELADTADWLTVFSATLQDDLHHDTIGVRRCAEPKSLTADVPKGRISSIAKPKSSSSKPRIDVPYTYTRNGPVGRWRERG